ncbi:MAG: WYL domain-containing protein [Micromonosporaceae bacterium]
MPHPASRVLAMLELLQNRDRVTGAELAGRLGVDERTVRRYATTLTRLGIPVAATRGGYGGYRLDPGARIPPLLLTDNEAIAVVVGLAAADQLGLTTEAPATAVALAKVHRLLPRRLAPVLAMVEEAVGFRLRPRTDGPRPAPPILTLLGGAVRDRRRVVLRYRPRDEPESVCELDPYGLVYHAGAWYLTGHDHRRGEVATYPVAAIVGVDLTGDRFTPPEDFDPVAHVTGAGTPGPTWEVEALLEADLARARERLPATAQLTQTADGVLLRARVARLEEAAAWLAGLGRPFTILRPDELREAVAAHAADLAAYARRPRPDRGATGPAG